MVEYEITDLRSDNSVKRETRLKDLRLLKIHGEA